MANVEVHHVYVHLTRKVEQRLDAIDQAVAQMQEQLREVLAGRQQEVDALTARLTQQSQGLSETVRRVETGTTEGE